MKGTNHNSIDANYLMNNSAKIAIAIIKFTIIITPSAIILLAFLSQLVTKVVRVTFPMPIVDLQ